MFFNCFRIRPTLEAPASASTTSPAETTAPYGSAQASPSRVNPHADQGAMTEASNQPAVLSAVIWKHLPKDTLSLVGDFLPLKDVISFETTNSAPQGMGKEGHFKEAKQEPIVKPVDSLKELREITPLCNRLHKRGYKIDLHLHFNQPLTEGVIPASVQQLTFGWYFNQP